MAGILADNAYFIFTVAPTSTKSITSAAIHNLEYFTDSLLDSIVFFAWMPVPMLIMARRPENPIIPVSECSKVTRRKEIFKIIITFRLSLMCIFLKR